MKHIYCPKCGRNRWHWLNAPCQHRAAKAEPRDLSGAIAWTLMAVTVLYVIVKMPW